MYSMMNEQEVTVIVAGTGFLLEKTCTGLGYLPPLDG